MTPPGSPPPPRNSQRTILGSLTQAVQTLQARVDFSRLVLKRNARVPELRVRDGAQSQSYPLLGDRYVVGRSQRSCDIVIRNPIVSQVHIVLERTPGQRIPFLLKDENSTNGLFRGQKRIRSTLLRHKDSFTLGPPELESAVEIQFLDPPPWYVRAGRWTLYTGAGAVGLAMLLVGIERQKFSVVPLPTTNRGPVIVLSRDQTPLTRPRTQVHGEISRLSDFSPYLAKAVIASEDSRYYWHLGVDPLGILRAAITNISGGQLREGASTITQQVARSLFRSYVGTEDSLGRKFREAVVALKLETTYSKDFILLTYLNRVYLGGDNNGFEDAAQFYFNKSARDLTLAEAATLVGILPAPNSFNPVKDYATALDYRNRVISRMVEQGMITAAEADRARRSRIEISPSARQQLQSTLAPYFYSHVFTELENLLGKDLAQEGNFIVETSLDLGMQTRAETVLQETVNRDGPNYGYSQAALMTLDFRTGDILALVGGTDFGKSQFNRATQALRQPGSTFKLFDYAAALEQGIPPTRSYSCAPLSWRGQNFAGCRRNVPSMDLFTGIALSENPIALRLAQDVGLDRIVRLAQHMGISSKLQAVPGLVLGQSEATLLEMCRAFAIVANGGVSTPALAVTRILDAGDCQNPQKIDTCRVIYDRRQEKSGEQILSAPVSVTLTTMLQGVVSSGTGQAANLGLGEAGKTGTTDDRRDLWFIGYIPNRSLLTGIWLGNDNNSPTSGTSGQAAALWGDYMRQLVQ